MIWRRHSQADIAAGSQPDGSQRKQSRLFQTAVTCGFLPLVCGAAILGAWLVTQWDWLMYAGISTVGGGLVLFTAGSVCLIIHACQALVKRRGAILREFVKVSLCALLLLVNFPAAYFCMGTAARIQQQYTVIATNDSSVRVERFLVSGPGVKVDLGPIKPGHTVKRHLDFRGAGPLSCSAVHEGISSVAELEERVDNNFRSFKRIQIAQNGVLTVSPTEHLRD